jgi:hypothetical protein
VGFIFRLLLAIIAFQLIGGLVRAVRRGKHKSRSRPKMDTGRGDDRQKVDQYRDLTPYEIEDAEFEELPKRED